MKRERASEKASRATPPGLAPERQSGRRALIIAQLGDAERSKRSFKLRTCQFSPVRRSKSFLLQKLLILLLRLSSGWILPRASISISKERSRFVATFGLSLLRNREQKREKWSVVVGEERRSPGCLSVGVAALKHSRLPKLRWESLPSRSLQQSTGRARDFSTPTPPTEREGGVGVNPGGGVNPSAAQ
ncbi:hypothetical protein KQX54_018383 [Cotesia glomerata]|uniref:Uncharacterized protein n=1 Tax=Cotesia glomerata TaxID=32391 RepID=A0AAV7IGT9_COTGL|nr:hypothetical protein KQX54_018383 [Cotesia glomerata]